MQPEPDSNQMPHLSSAHRIWSDDQRNGKTPNEIEANAFKRG